MRWRTFIVAAVLVGAVVAGGSIAWLQRAVGEPYGGWDGASVDVLLDSGLDAGSMLERLHDAGVVKHPGLLRLVLSIRGGSESLQAGEYHFERPLSGLEVLERLKSGDVRLYAITIPEGLTLDEIAERVADAGFSTKEDLLAAFRDPSPILDWDARATDLEGYLFPETYHFARGVDAQRVTRAMVRRFKESAGSELAESAAKVGLDLRQAVTLASMIEKETGVADERARVSRVFHNRMELRMKLQCDPTVRYALARAGKPVRRLRTSDLKFESPWNTYHVYGLPPGPIASAGKASLIAATQPIESNELYFVASPDGGHRFSENLQQHLQAVAEWRRHSRSSR